MESVPLLSYPYDATSVAFFRLKLSDSGCSCRDLNCDRWGKVRQVV